MLILSKRLHSIFMLRCFNDCFAVLFLWLAIFCLQRRSWQLGALFYTIGVGVKMTLLLALPAVAVILFLGAGFASSLRLAAMMGLVQALLGAPFLAENATGYLGRAFELSRAFLFEWTVNWRFMGPNIFSSWAFAMALAYSHITALVVFSFSWLKPGGKSLPDVFSAVARGRSPFTPTEQKAVSRDVTPQYILTTVLTANVIGLLFARSLHYQFYAYLAWATPFLLWRSGLDPVRQYVLWAAQEWAWNEFPSTPTSSGVVVGVMAMTVTRVWWESRGGLASPQGATVKSEKAKQ